MKDLTQGPIPKHVFEMAIPMAVGMFVQTLYYLVDLYFVSRLGDVALAGGRARRRRPKLRPQGFKSSLVTQFRVYDQQAARSMPALRGNQRDTRRPPR